MRLVHLIGVLGAVGLLAGCASNIKQMEEVQATGGTPFTQALTEEYRSFVAHEKDERDWTAADYFAIKGLAAAGGRSYCPKKLATSARHQHALTDGRARLMAALDGGCADNNGNAISCRMAIRRWRRARSVRSTAGTTRPRKTTGTTPSRTTM